MAHKHVFEAVNRTLQHVMGVVDPALKDMLFGGKVVVMGGDFRKILPVVPRGMRGQIVDASLKRSAVLGTVLKCVSCMKTCMFRGFWHRAKRMSRPMPNNNKLGQTTCNALGRAQSKSFLRLGKRLF
jgi:hypothetical protein